MKSSLAARIETELPKIWGWCDVDKALALASMVIALRPALTVEIGVFGGKSLIPLAMAHEEINHGTVWGIDPWLKDESVKGQLGANAAWWGNEVKHEEVFQHFQNNLTTFGLRERVLVLRQKSDDVTPPNNIGIFHCDGNHGPQAIADVSRFAPGVIPGGLCVMDDIGWEGGHVSAAVTNLEGMGFRRLYNLGTGAVFQRVK